jgi:prepilin-type N-terminal cleavage/methylation domain-containing protein
MKQRLITSKLSGFTIVELTIVIFVIGILATIAIVAYNGIQASARDSSILSDLDTLDGLETQCSLNPEPSECNLGSGEYAKAWYSGSGIDSYLNFTPSTGNVIDVVVNAGEYCIRGYNPNGTKNAIGNAYTKGSSDDACDILSLIHI